MITRNNSCFRNVNLKRAFTNDPYSGSNNVRRNDPGFLSKNSVGVNFENGKVKVIRKRTKRNKGKNTTGRLLLTNSSEEVDNSKVRVNNSHLGKRVN